MKQLSNEQHPNNLFLLSHQSCGNFESSLFLFIVSITKDKDIPCIFPEGESRPVFKSACASTHNTDNWKKKRKVVIQLNTIHASWNSWLGRTTSQLKILDFSREAILTGSYSYVCGTMSNFTIYFSYEGLSKYAELKCEFDSRYI